jgi:carbon storage regulator
MLVLSRKVSQSIQIGDDIEITIIATKGNSVRVGIVAPDHVRVARSELLSREAMAGESASSASPTQRSAAAGRMTPRSAARPSLEDRVAAAPTPNGLESGGSYVVEFETRPNQPVRFKATWPDLDKVPVRPEMKQNHGTSATRSQPAATDRVARVKTGPISAVGHDVPSKLEQLFPAAPYAVHAFSSTTQSERSEASRTRSQG